MFRDLDRETPGCGRSICGKVIPGAAGESASLGREEYDKNVG
jgi:hypothetical protein